MCFVLYAGTSNKLPEKEWREDAPDLSIRPLTERESPITSHFGKPHVQKVGSTSHCGCNFPHVTLENGEWPWWEDGQSDPEQEASDRYNREGLVNLLRQAGEEVVELYGVWDGDFGTPPAIRETITLEAILEHQFRFKERGFYVVKRSNKLHRG